MEGKYWLIEDAAGWTVDVSNIEQRLAAMKFGASVDHGKRTQRSHTRGIIHFLDWAGKHADSFPSDQVSKIVSRLKDRKEPVEAAERLEVIHVCVNDFETATTPSRQLKAVQIWNSLNRLGLVVRPLQKTPVAISHWMRHR
ncbi:hypothetical protein V6R98_09755 [Agrobacterium sp. CCNWLW71]|uniref:hypothetical protein n=1 Tax=unclassified Agrobacterium TaxID=2632611 RepID=UPI002FF1737D